MQLTLALTVVGGAVTDAQAVTRVHGGSYTTNTGGPINDTVTDVNVVAPGTGSNDLIVSAGKRSVRVRASGERIVPRGRCRSLARDVVKCRGRYDDIDVDVGGGDDRVTTSRSGPGWVTVDGGPGADELRSSGRSADLGGGGGPDRLYAGRSGDGLSGGAGSDFLQGGPGADSLAGDVPRHGATMRGRQFGDDVIDGGGGHDRAYWGEPGVGVVVDLEAGFASSRHDRDVVRGVETAIGGPAADRLFGSSVSNRLDGGAGTDLVDGREGDDVLSGGLGRDVISGQGGADEIDSGVDFGLSHPWAQRDRFTCGSGRDHVKNVRSNPVARDCELIEEYREAYIEAQPRLRAARRVQVQVLCHSDERRCSRAASILIDGKRIGRSAPARLRPGARRWLTVRLRRRLPSTGIISVHVRGSHLEDLGGGETERVPYGFSWRLRR